ncbi:MAG: TetR/AcrR family transcriptional regulator [Anaerolineae bacterium]|nr:TetR/AcrR family transcriptional regulator [Anaerolineae bacterium]
MEKADSDPPGSFYDERQQRILETASRLIAHYGYDKTTVADIAREAGISKGAIYLHYESKEKLFYALMIYEMERVVEDLLERIEADPDSGSLGSLYSHSLLALAANPLLRALTTRNKRIIGDFMRFTNFPYADAKVFSVEFIEHFQAAGLLRTDINPMMMIYLLSMIRYGLLMVDEILPADYVQSLDAVGEVLPDVLERAFAPPGGGNKEAGKQAIKQFVTASRQMLQVMKEKKV